MDLVAVAVELEIAQDRGRQQAHHVGEHGDLVVRAPWLFGDGRSADQRPALEHHGAFAGSREVRGGDEAVVPAADDDCVVGVRGHRLDATVAPMRTLRPRQAWGLGVLVACGALLALVAVAADGTPLRAPTDTGTTDIGERVLAALEVVIVIAVVMLVVLIVMVFTGEKNRRPQFTRRRSLLQTLLIVAILAIIPFALLPLRRTQHPTQEAGNGGDQPVAEQPVDDGHGRPTWPIALLGGAVVVALAWAAWSARRHRPDDEDDGAVAPDDEQRAAARSVFDASLADLEGEPDPRPRSSPLTPACSTASTSAASVAGPPRRRSSTFTAPSVRCAFLRYRSTRWWISTPRLDSANIPSRPPTRRGPSTRSGPLGTTWLPWCATGGPRWWRDEGRQLREARGVHRGHRGRGRGRAPPRTAPPSPASRCSPSSSPRRSG